MPAIEKFEFNSTVDHAQYWQGVGVSFTEFDEVFTGVGDTEREALDDAIEQFAQTHSGGLVTDEMNAERKTANDTDSAHRDCDPDADDMCELNWYVSLFIKWKEEEI